MTEAMKEAARRLAAVIDAMVRMMLRLFYALVGRQMEPALADTAAAIVQRAAPAPAYPGEDRRPATVVRMLNPSLGIRTRQAAQALAADRPIPASLLDPKKPLEKKILAWLERHKLDALGAIMSARPVPLEAHLNGSRPFPGLPPLDEAPKSEPYTYAEWIHWLADREYQKGNDEPDIDKIEKMAAALEKRNMSPVDLVWLSRKGQSGA